MMRRAVCLYHRIYINARVCCSRWFTDGVEGIHRRWHRCGASADTDIHGMGKVSVSAEDGISVISGSENTVR